MIRTPATALLLTAALATGLSAQRMRIGSSNPTGHSAGLAFSSALFAAGDTVRGVELWKRDAAGANLLIDVYPGPVSGYPTEITRQSATNGSTWFVARTRRRSSELGRELHFYPNLPTNTAGGWIRDLWPGAKSSHPAELTMLGRQLIFVAADPVGGRELWTSDGTAAGTVRLKDIVPGSRSSNPFGLIVNRGRVYFAATTAAEGTELWATDGTTAGTVLVRDIRPGKLSSTPSHFAVYRGRLYFAATHDRTGRELWGSNGTAAGTVLVSDVEPGVRSSAPTQLTASATELAFTASLRPFGRELFLYTGALTRKSNLAAGESIDEITASGSSFWFRARDRSVGSELWRTTAAGITLVHNLRPGAASSFPQNLFPFNNAVIFRATNGVVGEEYWRTNGAAATLIRDIRTGDCSARPSRLTPMQLSGRTTYLFSAKGDDLGIELYQTNGIAAGLIRNIDPLTPLPEMHWSTTPATMSIDIKDADPLQPAFIVISATPSRPLPLNGFRGALALGVPFFIIFQTRTDQRGRVSLNFPAPPIRQRTALLSQAAIGTTSGVIELTSVGTCNHGSRDLNPPNGPRVEARVCLDDESGEYTLCALRTDASAAPAFLGLYAVGDGGSDVELLQTYPIAPGEFFEDSGQIEILLPLDFLDTPGRHLELHLFEEEPTPTSPTPGSLVVQSYC